MSKLYVVFIVAVLVGYFAGVKYPSYGQQALAKVGV